MSGVNATFYFKDETILKIKSDFGEYNNNTLDIKFQKNIKAEYEKTSLEAQFAEYSNSEGLNISDDVKINDIQGNLFADKLSFNVKNKMLKIKTFNEDRINVNVNTDEKGFRILKFKKDNPIFEIKDVSKSFDGRPILKKLSIKVFLENVWAYLAQTVVEKQHYFQCVSVNSHWMVVKLF